MTIPRLALFDCLAFWSACSAAVSCDILGVYFVGPIVCFMFLLMRPFTFCVEIVKVSSGSSLKSSMGTKALGYRCFFIVVSLEVGRVSISHIWIGV